MKTEKKHVHLAKVASVAALVLTTSSVFAAIIPPGVVLADKQEFVRSNGSEPETLDPMLSESVPASQIVHDLFEGLTATNNEGVLQPGLATSWQQTSDTTWVFQLRKNAKWSDGTGITAHDVVYGIQRLVDPAIAARYAGAFGGFFLNGAEIVAGEKPHTDIGVKALDDYTLEIETAFPVPFLPELLANSQMGPAPRAAIEKHGKDWTKPGNMVSNGPFSLKDWRVNSKVVVEKNPHYWNAENVQLTQVTFLPIEDQNADLKLFQSGQTDMTASLPPGVYSALQKSHPNELKNSSNLGLRYYSLNHRDPLFQDVRVRQALSMVIDRDVMAEKITANGQKPTYSVILEGLHGAKPTPYAWQSWPMKERVAYAQKLLKDAGVKPGTKLKISYNTSDDHKKMALFMASEWKQKLGVHVAMENMEFKVFLKKRHDGETQIARNGWNADYNDASNFIALVQCRSSINDNFNCNEASELLIQQANATTDAVLREKLLTEAARIIMDDYPMVPVLQYSLPRLVKSYVGGYSLKNPVDRYRSKDLYIIKH